MDFLNTNIEMTEREKELKHALDYQIEFVLRLEEERLALFKETQTQKEQIKELMDMHNTVSFGYSIDNIHDQSHINEKKYQETCTQTEEKEHEANVTMDKKDTDKENDALEASSILNTTLKSEKNVAVKKKPLSDRMPVKSLKFKAASTVQPAENKEKENKEKNVETNTSKIKAENEVLTQQNLILKEEIEALKKEKYYFSENYKSVDKERNELKKELFSKDLLLENLRKENTELKLIVNSNDYNTIVLLEKEVKKFKELNQELNEELVMTRREKVGLEDELTNFKEMVIKLKQEATKETKFDKPVFELMKECKRMEAKIKELCVDLQKQREENENDKNVVNSLNEEKERLESDVEYFKNMAKTAKTHAEKAIADVDYYRNMLRSMNKSGTLLA